MSSRLLLTVATALTAASMTAASTTAWAQTSAATNAPAQETPANATGAPAQQAPAKAADSLSIFFSSGSATISGQGEQVLDQAARTYREGKPIIMQLWHSGRVSHSSFQPNHKVPVSSFSIPLSKPV